MSARSALFSLLILTAVPVATAADFVSKRKIEPSRIGELSRVLDEEMSPGRRFEHVTPTERAQVDAALARMTQAVSGKPSIADLDDATRIKVFNLQEQINAILTKRDNERVICEKRSMTGSHRKQSVCETFGEKMARRKNSRDRMNELNRNVLVCDEITTFGVQNSGGGGLLCTGG